MNVGINANIAKAQFDKYGLAAPITRPGGGFIYNAELTVPAEVARKQAAEARAAAAAGQNPTPRPASLAGSFGDVPVNKAAQLLEQRISR